MEKLISNHKKILEAFCQVAEVPVTFFDVEGHIGWEYMTDKRICNFFDVYREKGSPCTLILEENAEIASKLGEPYLFSCQAGFTNIVLSLIIHGEYRGYFIVGPLAQGRISEEILSNILTINRLNTQPETLLKLTLFLKSMKVHTTKSIEQISVLFNSALLSAIMPNMDYVRLSGLQKKLASLSTREHEHRGDRGELRAPEESRSSEKRHPIYYGSSKLITQALQIIQSEYMNDISLEYVAKKLFVNQSYLSMHFKHEMGVTFTDFLNEVRINAGKRLLVDTNLSLLEVSMSSGFEDQSYFAKVFKKLQGCTPREYRSSTRGAL